MDEMTPAQRSAIIAAIQDGRKIEAIKLYRRATGSNLVAAKHFIETLQHALTTGTVPDDATLATDQSEATIVRLLQEGKKIEAIKVYRDATGAGLRAAKASVEAIASERGIESGSGCGPAVLFFALVIAGTIWLK